MACIDTDHADETGTAWTLMLSNCWKRITRPLAKGMTIFIALVSIGMATAGCTGSNARGGTANNTPANILRPHGTTTPSTGTAGDTP
jgi:hypothetical protein